MTMIGFLKVYYRKIEISNICIDVTKFVPSLKSKKILHKSTRSTSKPRMEATMAPTNKEMLQTHHMELNFYKRYKKESKVRKIGCYKHYF